MSSWSLRWLHWGGSTTLSGPLNGEGIVWDNASYYRSAAFKDFISQENQNLAEASWKIFCMPFEPYAPEQNPIAEVWLKGKNFLRKNFVFNKTFASVKQCFVNFLTSLQFDSQKFNPLQGAIPRSLLRSRSDTSSF